MFHARLLELEAEVIAEKQVKRGFEEFPLECFWLLEYVEKEVGIKLASEVPNDWRGWLSYRRAEESLVICRGRAFSVGGIFGTRRAGLDVTYGLDTITEYERGFDVSPPQDLDHLLLNFGSDKKPRVFLWYGENLEPYRLIFEADAEDGPHQALSEAVVEACTWVLKRPKDLSLSEFLAKEGKDTNAVH